MERGTPVPESRPPWARAGWLASASRWIVESSAASGLEPRGRVEPIEQWPLSSVLRLETDRGRVYYKAAFSLFLHEPVVTVALAKSHRELVPEILAVDEWRGWMLMRELRGTQLGESDADRWRDGLRAIAGIQREWVGRETQLFELGAQDRTLEALSDEMPRLFDAVVLTPEERARLDRVAPELERMCAELRSGPVPETLIHGDFHPWNLMLDGGVRIFDWSDACVSYPFFDLPTFLRRTDDDAARESMLAAYLEAGSDVAPLPGLRALTDLARPLAHVHDALSYLRILDALEPDDRWYFADEPRRWLLGAVELVEAMR